MRHPALLLAALALSGCAAGAMPFGAAQQAGGARAQAASRDVVALLRQDNPVIAARDGGAGFDAKLAALAESPWRFFRGAGGIYYRDAAKAFPDAESIPLMGDLHLENMSAQPMGSGVGYDLDDFDDAFTGPARWEIARGATSVYLAAQALGFSQAPALEAYFDGYEKGLGAKAKTLAGPPDADDLGAPAQDAVKKAKKADRASWIAKYAAHGRLIASSKLKPLTGHEHDRLIALAQSSPAWRFGTVLDVGERFAGTASIGGRRWVFLTAGASPSDADDGLVEWKEEQAPVVSNVGWRVGTALAPAARVAGAARYFLPAQRDVPSAVSDGAMSLLQRPLGPDRADVGVADLKKPKDLEAQAKTLGLLAGRAHARSGHAPKLDAKQRGLLADFARREADQITADHAALVAARRR